MLIQQPAQQKIDGQQSSTPVPSPRVFVDFHNADTEGRLRLNSIGTIEDLAAQNVELKTGQLLTLYSEELEVNGVVEFSQQESLWVALVDWNNVREVGEETRVNNARRPFSPECVILPQSEPLPQGATFISNT